MKAQVKERVEEGKQALHDAQEQIKGKPAAAGGALVLLLLLLHLIRRR